MAARETPQKIIVTFRAQVGPDTLDVDGRTVHHGDQGGRVWHRRDGELVHGVPGDEDLPVDERGPGRGCHLLDLRRGDGVRHRVHVLPRAGNEGEVHTGDSGGAAERRPAEDDRLNRCALRRNFRDGEFRVDIHVRYPL